MLLSLQGLNIIVITRT